MANRRMFSKAVVESDAFMDLPHSAQALYLHLGMVADDDGFVSSPKRVCKMCDCTEEDLDKLIAANRVIAFDSGVIVITEWKMNNYLAADRHTPTSHTAEKELLIESDKRYIKKSETDTECIQDVYTEDVYAGQNREEQNRTEKNREDTGEDYTPQALMQICLQEHIKLAAPQIASFINEMNLKEWKIDGKPIKNIGAVLRMYSQTVTADRMNAAKMGAALGYND